MAFNCELPDAARRELILLGIWYRARHSQGYRRLDEKIIGSTIDPVTGFELSEADLRAPGEAIRGPDFVFAAPIMPDRLAEECLLRDEWDGSTPSLAEVQGIVLVTTQPDLRDATAIEKGLATTKEVIVGRYPTNERGRAEEEMLHLRKEHPEWKPVLRDVQGRSAWTEEEAEAFSELHYGFQKTLLDFASKGWVRLEPPTKFTSRGPESLPGADHNYVSGLDDKGMPYVATCTPEGLDEAERRIRDDPVYSRGAFSAIEAFSGEKQAAVASRNPWAAIKRSKEDGAGA